MGTAATKGGSGTGTEPARRPPLDIWRAAAFGSTVPAADIRLGSETRYSGKGSWDGRRNRDIPEARRAEGWRLRQCHPWTAGNSPNDQRSVLVLWRRLQSRQSTGIPQARDEAVRGATRSSPPEVGTAERRGEEGNQADSTLAVPGTTKAVSHPGSSPGTAEDWEKLDHAMPIVRRGGTRQERRPPGDLGRRTAEVHLLGWLQQGDDSSGSGMPDSGEKGKCVCGGIAGILSRPELRSR